jgi:hypothetical protein
MSDEGDTRRRLEGTGYGLGNRTKGWHTITVYEQDYDGVIVLIGN